MEEANVSPDEATPRGEEMETPINQEAEETSEEETSSEESQETSEQEPDNEQEKLKREHGDFKARALKAESKLKAAKQKGTEPVSADPFEFAKSANALRDYSTAEIDYIEVIAKGMGLSPEDAVKTTEVKTYVEATRRKVQEDKQIPNSSSPKSGNSSDKSDDELAEIAKDPVKWAKFEEDELKKSVMKRRGI